MKKENAVVKNDGILSLTQDLQRQSLPLCLCNSVRGRWQIKSAMTSLYRRAFTLIELLVVVLIIGILAAVAVPQYQKAVEKSRAAEAMQILKSLRDAQALCILEHGASSDACGWGDGGTQGIGELFDNISVDIPGEIVATPFDGDGIQTKYFQYGVISIDDDVADLCASRSISSDDGYTICTSANPNGGVYYNQFICTHNTAQWCPSLGFKQSGSKWIL